MKHKLEFMGPFPIMQINDDVTVRFQKGIINDAPIFAEQNHSSDKQQKYFSQHKLFLFKQIYTNKKIFHNTVVSL